MEGTACADEDRLMTVREVARYLGVGEATVWRLVWGGGLQSLRIGRCRRVRASALGRYVGALEEEEATPPTGR